MLPTAVHEDIVLSTLKIYQQCIHQMFLHHSGAGNGLQQDHQTPSHQNMLEPLSGNLDQIELTTGYYCWAIIAYYLDSKMVAMGGFHV